MCIIVAGGRTMDYVAIIGDIKQSKKIENRIEVQKKLDKVLKNINVMYQEDIAARFLITLGDEFQGLLKWKDNVFDIIKYIQRNMYPVELRFGIGIGEISTDIFYEAAIGADGPAYYAARQSIQELHEKEKKFKKHTADIQMGLYNKTSFDIEEINMMLSLIKTIEDSWTEKQRYTIWDMIEYGGSQTECAKRMKTSQSTVARRLAEGNYLIYKQSGDVMRKAIKRIGEEVDGN